MSAKSVAVSINHPGTNEIVLMGNRCKVNKSDPVSVQGEDQASEKESARSRDLRKRGFAPLNVSDFWEVLRYRAEDRGGFMI